MQAGFQPAARGKGRLLAAVPRFYRPGPNEAEIAHRESEDQLRLIADALPMLIAFALMMIVTSLAMLRGRHRFRLLVHARRAFDVQDMIRDWLGALEWSAKVRVAVDVDPYSFL